MLVTFLQQCGHSLYNAARDGSLNKPMAENIRQNRHKYLRHLQVHFIGQTIKSWQLVEADLLQRVTDFTLCNQPFAGSYFCLLKAREVGKIPAKLLKRDIRLVNKTIKKMYSKVLKHLTAKSEHMTNRGFNGLDVLMKKPLCFLLTSVCIIFHDLVFFIALIKQLSFVTHSNLAFMVPPN